MRQRGCTNSNCGADVDTRITLTPDRLESAPLAAPRRKAPRDCPCCRRARWVHYGMCAYTGVLGGLWLTAVDLPVWTAVPVLLAVGITGSAISWTLCTLAGMTAPKYWSQ
jgi:hypothetical protein